MPAPRWLVALGSVALLGWFAPAAVAVEPYLDFLHELQRQGYGEVSVEYVQSLQNTELKELARRMSEFIGGGSSLGVVLSRRPAVAACLANRFENIRAVWACTPRALSEAMQTMAPNVITYNPGDHAGFAQRSLLQAFLRGGK